VRATDAHIGYVSLLDTRVKTSILIQGRFNLIKSGLTRRLIVSLLHFCEFLQPDAVHKLIDLIGQLHVLLVKHSQVIFLRLVYQGKLLKEYAFTVFREVYMRYLSAELSHHQVVRLDITTKVFEFLVFTGLRIDGGIGPAFLLIYLVLGVIELRARELPELHLLPLCHMLHDPLNVI
jgi:hypothetical protein